MGRFTLERRTVLRAAGQAAITLPFLEIMNEGKARAATAPRRLVVMLSGASLCRNFQSFGFWAPSGAAGRNYAVGRDLNPLGPKDFSNGARTFKGYDVQDQVSIVSGLKVPWVKDGVPPPGGRSVERAVFHGSASIIPTVTGMGSPGYWTSGGPSCDEVLAGEASFTAGTAFKSLHLAVQPSCLMSSCSPNGTVSWKANGDRNYPQVSPQAAFKTIFPLIKEPGTSAASMAQLGREKSILDFWVRRTDRLKARLGRADNARLDGYFSQIRDVEKRINLTPTAKGPACTPPKDPGPDPEIFTRQYIDCWDPAGFLGGYSGETERVVVMRELLFLSLACDLTRVATLVITWGQAQMNAKAINGRDLSLHQCSHAPSSEEEYADILAWHVEQLAHITSRLRETDDADGNKMIDNTVLTMLTEGGWGHDPDVDMEQSPHSSEGLSLLVAGGKNLGLDPGRHIPKNNQAHPASVFVSIMKAMGVNKPLGEVTAGIPELGRTT